ncbi:PhzF family phenazine biosynthesis protein [Nitzschia inconspicua]|uniref:PhzF family phenazine biosynthesis protein n=1 Tax=Nitzschia inconspicua TaxID=303405 RepID=A0A9K3Q0S8_9STRA|nr:PhzF family phenazine biosynthesis protein [Nitzschia inconspicua]
MAATTARRILVEQVKARVFCSPNGGGGNPVTIFSTDQKLTAKIQKRLARSCDWESVILHRPVSKKPLFSFYMPSGAQVTFCAHAAMGAAYEMCRHQKPGDIDGTNFDVIFTVADLVDSGPSPAAAYTPQEYQASINSKDKIVRLKMETFYKQEMVSRPALLSQVLREHCSTEKQDLLLGTEGTNFDDDILSSCFHASIARPKTLVPLKSRELVNEKAVAPTSPDEFAQVCRDLDETTGLYLYAQLEDEEATWECRQFPSASGYPEDPATGIAAAALACHLKYQQKVDFETYKIYQGTAMGNPSLIVLEHLDMRQRQDENDNGGVILDASFLLFGHVEIDGRVSFEIEDEIAGE